MSVSVDKDVNVSTDPCLLAWDDRLYVGCEDGSVKSFDASLEAGASWSAHDVQVYALEAGDNKIYSSSNEGTIKVWSPKGDLLKEIDGPGSDVCCLRIFQDRLYAGDEAGKVAVYEKEKEIVKYNILEEVKDIIICTPYMMTVRDLDVTINEIRSDTSKSMVVTRHTTEGRAPMRLAGNKLLVVTRDGKSIRVHDNSMESKYKLLHEQKASELILTSLAVETCGKIVWSGGWDGKIRRWTLGDSNIVAAGDLDLGACINALVTSKESNVVYAAVAGGRLVKIKFA